MSGSSNISDVDRSLTVARLFCYMTIFIVAAVTKVMLTGPNVVLFVVLDLSQVIFNKQKLI